MALCLINPDSPWYIPSVNVSVKTETATTANITTANITTENTTTANITNLAAGHAEIGGGTRTNTSFITVGNSSSLHGISFLNNLANYTPAELNAYSEATQIITYTSEIGNVSANCTNYYRRVGGQVFLTLGGFTMTDAGSILWTSTIAMPAGYRPGTTIYNTCFCKINGVDTLCQLTVSSDGTLRINIFPPSITAGTTNGLLTCSISYSV